MKKITSLPKFMPGQVIDLSYKNKGLPNRILIKTVFIKEQNSGWMYEVYLENTGETSTLDEAFITNNMTKKESPVYKCREIINLYNDGWRFCGNLSIKEANLTAAKLATNRYIKNIILRHALNYHGCLVSDKYGMWIRYNNTINNDGTIVDNTAVDTDIIIVK